MVSTESNENLALQNHFGISIYFYLQVAGKEFPLLFNKVNFVKKDL